MRFRWVRRNDDDAKLDRLNGEAVQGESEDAAFADPEELWNLEAALIGDEVEAFLGGDLAEYRVMSGQTVLPWMLLNRLAHASHTLLETVVAVGKGRSTPEMGRGWQVGEMRIARDLADRFPTADQLRMVQRQLLVPLELELSGLERQLSPHQVMHVTAVALDLYLEKLHQA